MENDYWGQTQVRTIGARLVHLGGVMYPVIAGAHCSYSLIVGLSQKDLCDAKPGYE